MLPLLGWLLIVFIATWTGCQAALKFSWDAAERWAGPLFDRLLPPPMADLPGVDDDE